MDKTKEERLVELLDAWGEGDLEAFNELFAAYYEPLKKIASRFVRGESRQVTVQTTMALNEAYLRLLKGQILPPKTLSAFESLIAETIFHLLIDLARKRNAAKREGDALRVTFEEQGLVAGAKTLPDILALERALEVFLEFKRIDPRAARFFLLQEVLGKQQKIIAENEGLSSRQVRRDVTGARAWLAHRMRTKEQQ